MGWLKYFPHERHVDDFKDSEDEEDNGETSSEKGETIIRIPKNRSIWSFFDEFEYRPENKGKISDIKKTSKAERILILKLDIIITFYAFVGYWCKYLDSANLNNAYVSGMKESLGMKGNDLVNTQVLFTVGSTVVTLPFAYILPRLPSTYVLFAGEFIWSLFTLVTYTSPDVKALKAFRFIVGAAETSFFPIIHHLLASWYKPTEISRRGGSFYVGQYLGILTAGLLQSSIFDNLNGKNGLAGWQWVYIIEGLVSFAITFLGFFLIPGTPFKCYSIFLTDDEIRLARKRMRKNGSDDSKGKTSFFDKNVWLKMVKSWHFWIFSLANIGGFNATNSTSGSFSLWLKSLNRYSVGKLNNLTPVPPALGIIWVFITTFGADLTKKRFLMICFSQTMNLIGNIILAIWDVNEKAKWFAFYFSYWAWAQSPVFYPLQNDILRQDSNLRAIEWVTCYVIGVQSSAWIPKLVWQTEEAPRFHKGFITAGVMGMFQSVLMIIGLYFYKKDERKHALERGIIIEVESTENLETGSAFSLTEKEVEKIHVDAKSQGKN